MSRRPRLPSHRKRSCATCMIAVLLSIGRSPGFSQGRTDDAVKRGQELARRVLQAENTSGFRIRARVVIGSDAEDMPKPSVLQIRILGRREPGMTRVLYQVLYPASLKGRAAVIERRPGPVGGFQFEPPDRVTPMTPAVAASAFAGTAMTYEDLAENFWHWPQQRVAGHRQQGKQTCTVLESRPSQETTSAYSLIRSCIASRRPIALWIEKIDRNGKLAQRIAFENPGRENSESRMVMIVEGTDPARRTRVEIVKSERGITVSPDEFSMARLRGYASSTP